MALAAAALGLAIGHAPAASASPLKKTKTAAINTKALTPGGVFGSMEIATNKVSGAAQWRSLRKRLAGENTLYEACDQGASSCPGKVRTWRKSLHAMKHFSGWDLLAAVNSRINKLVRYRDDAVTYGEKDYWATPVEALTRRGDCEDYAILKYLSLRELGISANKMRIVVVKDLRRRIGHAVLSVELDGQFYILDSLRRAPVPDTSIASYQPFYSLNEAGQWFNFPTRNYSTRVASRTTIKTEALDANRLTSVTPPKPREKPQRTVQLELAGQSATDTGIQ